MYLRDQIIILYQFRRSNENNKKKTNNINMGNVENGNNINKHVTNEHKKTAQMENGSCSSECVNP